MILDPTIIRNIGISAHIDSGKTTLTERVLFYTKRIHAIHEVKGKDNVGATMDSMELERERGITIQSAATHCRWAGHHINIIDTPGHVDFTIEVERALRVLDGAILVLCAVAGVQSQSLTVDRQMRRYAIPRIAFVNKCDRSGSNPLRVRDQLREKLGMNPVLMQLPIGLEDNFEGVIDLVTMEALYFDGNQGQVVRREPIPDAMSADAAAHREALLDAVSMFSDELTEAMLEDNVEVPLLKRAIRSATLAHQITPVLMGSAYKNRGIQPLLDGILDYLAAPSDRSHTALAGEEESNQVQLSSKAEDPLVALAFKVEEGRFGQLTYLRLYQGTLRKGDPIVNVRSGKTHKVGRLVRMHADEMEEIDSAASGDIVAMFGIECAGNDTFTDGKLNVAMASIHVPAPVITLTVKCGQTYQANLSKALRRFGKEDPTFHVAADPETGETTISGMGELHLEVYLERIRREYSVPVETSPPRVAYREAITIASRFDYTHKKQTGGSGTVRPRGRTTRAQPRSGLRVRRRDRRRRHPPRVHLVVRQGLQVLPAQGPHDRSAGHRHSGRDRRRLGARGGLLGHRVPGSLPRRLASGLLAVQTADPRARDEGRGRGPGGVPGRRGRHAAQTPRNRRGHGGRRWLRASRVAGPTRRDVRLFDGAALFHAGQGRVHDGICALLPGARSTGARADSTSLGKQEGLRAPWTRPR